MNLYYKLKKRLGNVKRFIIKYFNENKTLKLIKWVLNRPALPKSEKTFVHLGCGIIDRPGFINVDKLPFPHVHFLSGVEKLPFLKNSSVDMIYISHCLEHIEMKKIVDVLKEYNRVLKKGGVLRISVPDFKVIVKMYNDSNDLAQIWEPLLGGQDYKYNFHFSVFDKEFLSKLLKESGFSIVEEWVNGQDENTEFGDWSGRPVKVNGMAYPISLNLQAIK